MNSRRTFKRARHGLIAAVATAAMASVGCGRDAKPAAAPEASQAPDPAPVATVAPTPRASLEISPGIKERCDLPNTPNDAPRFDYDETALRPRGEDILADLARCLNEGKMKGQSVSVTGHADPRGSDEYNLALGQQRARAAADYLQQHGVPASRISVRSRGEQDASGTNEDGWKLDRNVQIAEAAP